MRPVAAADSESPCPAMRNGHRWGQGRVGFQVPDIFARPFAGYDEAVKARKALGLATSEASDASHTSGNTEA